MKIRPFYSVLALLLLVVAISCGTPRAAVQITYIFYDGLVPYSESDEYVEITNVGNEPKNLAGCMLIDADEGYPRFVFPSYILEPGESVRVYTNEEHPEWGGFSFGSKKAVWNNEVPDTAELRDSDGNVLSQMSY